MAPVQDMQHPSGPPYAPTTAGIGGRPTELPDVPVLAVLLLFYIGGAASNLTILQRNNRRGHKFPLSGLLFGFSMARILTCCLRIGATYKPQNISLSIASSIFVNAGILIVYIVNLILAQRIMRARQPDIGWSKAFKAMYAVIFFLIAIALMVVITFIVISFYTLDQHLQHVSRDLQLAAITYLLIVTMVPIIIVMVAFGLPKPKRIDEFGEGSWTKKVLVLTASATLCVLGAGFKAGANWEAPRPVSNPGWYQKKAAFYNFVFMIEIFIIYLLIISRVDKLFHVRDKSSKDRQYKLESEREEPQPMEPEAIESRELVSSEACVSDRSKEEA